MSREQIRQAFKEAAETVFHGPVYTSRVTDNRDDNRYVSIYIDTGDVSLSSSGKSYESSIVVRYCQQRATDEDLDIQADLLVSAIESSVSVRQLVRKPLLTGFEYEPDGTHNGLNHIFRILY